LARALARPSNLLVLHEPTNDLDLETLDLLQEKLAEYAGTVLLISHDRDFLDRAVTSIVASEGNGRRIEYAGGYTDMLAQRAAAQLPVSGAKTGRPKRPRAATRSVGSVGAPPPRMNFNDQRALELLPARIAALETQVAELTTILADPNLYAHDRARFDATAEALAVARQGLAAAEDQWLRLELLREGIEAAELRY
jgi:ATP-binding cassette subfamily F protein uup